MNCMHGTCMKCHGIKKLVVGALLLLNAFVWPKWLGVDGWVSFVALLMLIGGVLMLVKPTCPHCSSMPNMSSMDKMAGKKMPGKKRKR